MEQAQDRGVEQTVARRDNRPEVAGSTPAPATSTLEAPVKRGPGRPRKNPLPGVEPEAESKAAPLLVVAESKPAPPLLHSCITPMDKQLKDLVKVYVQIEPEGYVHHVMAIAAEPLKANKPLEFVPGCNQLVRMRR